MFTKLGELGLRYPRSILGAALVLLVLAGIFGAPVAVQLPSGGYEVGDSESSRATAILNHTFDVGGMPIVFEITGSNGPDASNVRDRAHHVIDALTASGHAQQINSYWTAAASATAASLLSSDRRTGLVVAEITGGDSDAPPRAHDIAKDLVGTRDGVTVKAGGQAIAYYDFNRQSRIDLVTVEAIAVPFTFVVLVWVFGSAVAAMVPLLVAAFAVAGTTAALRLIFAFTNVSVFALNLTTALCLALAIDYTLFIIERYREEITDGAQAVQALITTLNTAGRTVTYSAITVALSLATMAVFPMYFLRSLAYAGVICVGLSLMGALVVAPALLVVLGARIDAWDIRTPILRLCGRQNTRRRPLQDSFFYRTAVFCMRYAVPVIIAVTALFAGLGAPFRGIQTAYPDDRTLPSSASSRQAGDVLREQFPRYGSNAIRIVLPTDAGSTAGLSHYAAALSRTRDVAAVAAPDGTYVAGARMSTDPYGAEIRRDAAYLTVSSTLDPFSPPGEGQLVALKAISAPGPTLFDGTAQRNIDDVHGITSRIPLVLALVAITTLVLVFLFTGSMLLPVKAVLMNALSLTASFGAMVWIFQEGHLGGFGTTTTGNINAAFPPLIFCLAFGLSMDYEVFVLSRIREEWLRTPRQTASDNDQAVAVGLARTGRIVTAAATVMAIVFVAMIASQQSNMRMLGTGLTITVLLDAFVVRTVLVPAVMKLMGRVNWWAPGPLARWHTIWGLHEGPTSPSETVQHHNGQTTANRS
ncbi:MMPL family transporter [Mycolicibacterium aubagnense]|uniref:Membrane protein, MmpL family n=1 Tax=Mycolicibacterium aubagnense TaxID=319707 RepID=A0ABM7IJD7_9MYCO|nr:MMPL family transporter [Mycolicibacterium aubagnense]WGI31665.1 MMPL family transporter [Mycolicibacterium aubagnense]BBX86855.1 putative membrane protein, MmpL family [Mycolicibacterium aubagnense]